MKFEPFYLERWLNSPKSYDLAGAGIVKLRLKDITEKMDPELVISYGITKGSADLRGKVADLYSGVDPEDVLVTTGAAEANLLVLLRLLEPGDELVALTPTYMQCIGLARGLGARVTYCPLSKTDRYGLDAERLRKTVSPKTKIILCVNPNNPTGSVYSQEDIREICAAADSVGAWVLCDGALRGLEMNGEWAAAPYPMYGRGINTGSLSKVGLTGIRTGWMISDRRLIEDCWALKDYSTLCHTGVGEYLAEKALEPANMARYIDRARTTARVQSAMLGGWVRENHGLVDWIPPAAGHTAFVRYNLDMSSTELCEKLLAEEEVLVSPGDYFDTPKHLRIRHSCGREELEEGLKRLGAFLRRHGR